MLLVLSPIYSYGKNETLNWNFGDKAALTFNTPNGDPVAMEGSSLSTLEGCSAISDSNGYLLFYTDGVKVWNRSNRLINTEQDLMGHYSSTQSVLIVKKPEAQNLYYIFTSDAGRYTENIDPTEYDNRGLRYSIVDMSLNNGLGDIIEYNTLVHVPITEKLTAVNHFNQKDIWLISHEWGNNHIIAYLITKNGISQKIVSESSTSLSGSDDRYIGHIKASPVGDKVAYVVQGFDFFELQEFDNKTGLMSNPIKISTGNRSNNYGIEFSPSGKKIYISEYKSNTVYQYDLSIYNSDSIKKTEKLIERDDAIHSIGALQLGPNGKIYLALNGIKYLAVINEPELSGDSCNYVRYGVYLGNEYGVRSRLGLPNLNQSFYSFRVNIDYKETCQNETLYLNADLNAEFDSISYSWIGPNGFTSNQKNIQFDNAYINLSGKYYLSATYRNYTASDSAEITIKYAPRVNIIGDTLICQNTYAKLEADKKSDTLSYIWSTGSRDYSTIISSPGIYTLQTIYPNGCSAHDTIIVNGLITNAGFTNPEKGLFGDVNIDKSLKISLNFVNYSSENLFINKVYFQNNSKEIKIVSKDFEKSDLSANQSIFFDVEIFSKMPAFINDTIILEIVSPYCVMYFKAPIIGRIVVPMISRIPDLVAKPADEINIPVFSKINTDTKEVFTKEFTAYLSLPANYFKVEECFNGDIISNDVIDNTRIFVINGKSTQVKSNESPILSLRGKVMVGTELPANIEVIKIDWKDDLFINQYQSGKFVIESCSLAIRQIQLFEPTKMLVFPNPTIDNMLNVTIESQERGDYKLILANTIGNSYILSEWKNSDGIFQQYSYKYELGNVASGNYTLILFAPWSIHTQSINLIR